MLPAQGVVYFPREVLRTRRPWARMRGREGFRGECSEKQLLMAIRVRNLHRQRPVAMYVWID